MATKKRRKPAADRKQETIQLRVTADQKRKLAEGAKRRGLGVSTWLLTLGLEAYDSQVGGSK